MSIEKLKASCCIVGGGPAGIMLGFLLARAGIEVVVLEKHHDFFRDFRGDTIHPSTFNLMNELGFLEEFLKLPHEAHQGMHVATATKRIKIADFTRFTNAHPFLGFMPQWDFLSFLSGKASEYTGFRLRMGTEVTGLIEENGIVKGIQALTADEKIEIHASLVVGADGRASLVRQAAGLKIKEFGAPVDILWFRLSRNDGEPSMPVIEMRNGCILVFFSGGKYYQCGYVISKNSITALKTKGLPAFQKKVTDIIPFMKDRINDIKDWDEIKLLTVKIDRLENWYKPGLLCIGDAAHAMSPMGGVGINLAIQDAVATANILYSVLKQKAAPSPGLLRKVQKRREFPTAVIQSLQGHLQENIMKKIIDNESTDKIPYMLRLFQIPFVPHFSAWLFGLGIRQEHIKTPDVR